MKIILFVLLAISLTSCTYTRNRINDAKDIFTLCVNPSLGCQVQAGPIWTGIGASCYGIGVSEGYLKIPTSGKSPLYYRYILVGPGSRENEGSISEIRNRGKEYTLQQSVFIGFPEYKDEKALLKPYYTQFEVDVGVGLGLRVGANPGEFLDFFLGFFGVDMYGDDICTDEDDHPPPKDKNESPPQKENVRPPPWK